MHHQIALPDFSILLSKLRNRKFNPTGIGNEWAGLVAVRGFLRIYTVTNYKYCNFKIFCEGIIFVKLAYAKFRKTTTLANWRNNYIFYCKIIDIGKSCPNFWCRKYVLTLFAKISQFTVNKGKYFREEIRSGMQKLLKNILLDLSFGEMSQHRDFGTYRITSSQGIGQECTLIANLPRTITDHFNTQKLQVSDQNLNL